MSDGHTLRSRSARSDRSTRSQQSSRSPRRRAAATAALALLAAALVTTGGTSESAVAAKVAVQGAAQKTTHAQKYGGTKGWTLATRVDLTKEPAGTSYTAGVRVPTDQSTNRREQAVFGPKGLVVTAERVGGTIYSADVMMRGIDVPDVAAVEVDVTMRRTGPGLGHAVWFRPRTGSSGEMDLLEYIGSNAGKGIDGGPGRFESKSTLIRTGGSPYNLGSEAFGIPPRANGTYNGLRRYRYEFTKSSVSLWVDGVLAGTITKAAFEKQNGTGSWAQFAAGTHWYPRVTLQVNNGTSAKLWGTVPGSWKKSRIKVSAMRIYQRG